MDTDPANIAKNLKPLADVFPQGENPDLLQTHDRITAQLLIHHEHFGEQPEGVTLGFSEMLETIAAPYPRRIVDAGDVWKKLDTADLGDNVGTLVIENRAGRSLTVVRSADVVEKLKDLRLLVSLRDDDVADIEIPAGRFVMFNPRQVEKIRIRGKVAGVPFYVFEIPK